MNRIELLCLIAIVGVALHQGGQAALDLVSQGFETLQHTAW